MLETPVSQKCELSKNTMLPNLCELRQQVTKQTHKLGYRKIYQVGQWVGVNYIVD